MNKKRGLFSRFFGGVFSVLNTTRIVVINAVFLLVVFLFIIMLTTDDTQITVPNNSALVLNLRGDLVEQKVAVDPMDAFLNEAFNRREENPEVLLANVIDVIESAKHDNRINMIVLKLDQLTGAGLSKLQDLGHALSNFKESGKEIIAVGGAYSQGQYYLASHADEVWLDPKGFLLLDGFGSYQLYFKSMLEKLSVSQHVFRVGTYKSAVEPYIRDNMSDEAKAANKLWLGDLWQQYKQDVAIQRNVDIENFDEDADTLIEKFSKANGSYAEYALQNDWVDSLKTKAAMRQALIEKVGKSSSGDSFKQIDYKSYLKSLNGDLSLDGSNAANKIAVVVAKGTILNGSQPAGTIGGESTANLLRKARYDDSVKAVVLRVDSPGGSAYASDVIRQEIELIKQAGKPVVASMGSLAASGGYWISAAADKIVASPSTITGSIGIFGMFMTLENTLSKVGIYTDGVGTTDLSGFGVTRPLSNEMSTLFQMSIERGYRDFIDLVATNRGMSVEQVDQVAQGRVWSGVKAKELGLVDELGSLDEAIAIAAELAELTDYDRKLIEKRLSPTDLFWQNFLDSASKYVGAIYGDRAPITKGPASQLVQQFMNEVKQLDQFNDPQGIYSFCLTCQLN
ncbi:signal peptide peptidase SppA [Thalassotalea euphylliae]|uniref:signal peptide peptidase SppA n=1 Tax=Thalassotalea euphylliae TaxID=1655234 RepID=UPI00363E5EED